MNAALLALLFTLPAAGPEPTDDPMIRWDCDRAADRLVLEMVRPPIAEVTAREQLLFSGTTNFEQCQLGAARWTLLVDIVEYHSGRCEPEPDTVVSLLRNDRLVVLNAVIGRNCSDRPVLSALRITESGNGAEPTLELCAASSYGGESGCSTLAMHTLDAAISSESVADHARNGARRGP